MLIVHVHVHVKEGMEEDFKRESLENAKKSAQEPGIARFDVLQQADDPRRFVLIEVYRRPEDSALHKETEHYQTWRCNVAEMMEEPRRSVKYANAFPDDAGWG